MDKDVLVISPYDSPVLELTYTSYEWMNESRARDRIGEGAASKYILSVRWAREWC